MRRAFGTGLLVLLAAMLALYLGDAMVLHVRVNRGTAYGVVQVNQFLATPLKGQKVEYDVVGTLPVTCGRSIFPQMSLPACWWVQRHASQWR